MSTENPLERRYGRLLIWYPAEHRRQHEQEMLGVLMSSADPRQRRPGLADSADLLWGALRVRLRPGLDSAADPGWRDALAALSVIVPLSIIFLRIGLDSGDLVAASAHPRDLLLTLGSDILYPMVLVVLVVLRLRRTAALAAAGLMIWWLQGSVALIPLTGFAPAAGDLAYIGSILGLEIAALLASPGPRRGFQILTWKLRLPLAVAATTVSAAPIWSYWHPNLIYAGLAVTIVVVTAMIVTSPLSRRILVLLMIPFCAIVLPYALPPLPSLAGQIAADLPSVVISGLVVVAARRSSRTATVAASGDS